MNTAPVQEVRELAARMRRVAARFRAAHPLSPPVWSAGSYPLAVHVNGRPGTKVLVWFPSPGCTWSLKGGCTMCDFGHNPDAGTVEDAVAEFSALLDRLDPGVQRIHIGPGGSFYAPEEVSAELRRAVLASLGRLKFLTSVGIETRPSLTTRRRLLETIEALPATVHHLTVGFGFECRNDLVREVTVNKGYGPRHIAQAVAAINVVNGLQRRVQVGFEIYVLLKPLFLNEQEGIDEALRTLHWAYAQGAENAVLFLNTVKNNTVQGHLAGRSDLEPPLRYAPPYYRSAVQVVRSLPDELRRRTTVLGTQSGVLAQGMPRGCPLCSPFLLGALTAYNFTGDPAILDQAAASFCPCKDEWQAELDMTAELLGSRIRRGIEALEETFAGVDSRPPSDLPQLALA